MLIIKTISTAIDIQDCIKLYTDLENNLLQILADRYEGTCHYSCLIKRVVKIVRYSNCVINQDGEPTFGTMNVTFDAEGIEYTKDEVINNCVITKTEVQGVILAATNDAVIMFSTSPLFASLIAGQLMSVRVNSAIYNRGTDKISVSAIPFIPHYTPTVYRINGAVDQETRQYVKTEMDKIANELATPSSDAREFFKDTLYPYKEPKPTPETVRLIDLLTDSPPAEGYLSRDPGVHLDNPGVWYYPTDEMIPEGAIVQETENIKNVLFNLLHEYAEQLRVWREHSEIYADKNVFMAHKNLMLIYRKSKVNIGEIE